MSVTCFGVIANDQGYCRWHTPGRLEDLPGGGVRAVIGETTTRFDPGYDYADSHPRPVPIHLHHTGRPVGELVYLARTNGRLTGVGVIHDIDRLEELPTGPWYWSATTLTRDRRYEITECSLTDRPASVGLRPVAFWPSDIVRDWDPRRSDHDMRVAGAGILVEARSAGVHTHRARTADRLQVVDHNPWDEPGWAARPAERWTPRATGTPTGDRTVTLPDGTVAEYMIRPSRIIGVGRRR